jgi:regulator of sirC expression with transglutaminase-like and TPR domain
MANGGDGKDRRGGESGGGGGRGARIAAARRRFSEVAALPDEAIDLAEGALLIAAEDSPDLDVAANLARLDELARRVQHYLEAPGPDGPRHHDEAALRALHRVLFEEEGFSGPPRDVRSDPRNSFLNEVLERHRGLPIILSVVYCEVARRAGLDAVGIGLPGHFIVQFRGEHLSTFVDPYNGGARLTREECASLVSGVVGGPIELAPEHFLPATRKAILTRILQNLKIEYVQRGQLARALAAVERILLLGASLEQLRDRGLILRRMGLLLLGATDAAPGPGGAGPIGGIRGGQRAVRAAAAGKGSGERVPDQADQLAANQLLSAAWFDLKLYAREGADQPDAAAVQSAADAIWRRMARMN